MVLRARKKDFRRAALCLLCLILPDLTLAAQEDGWVEIAEDVDGNVLSLYLPSVETREHYSGSYIVGWIRWTYSDIGAEEFARGGVKADHSMDFCAANPKARQWQIISATYYDKDGRQIYSTGGSFNSYSWKEFIPGSIGESIWYALMAAAGYL